MVRKLHSRNPLNNIIQRVMETITNWAFSPPSRDDITVQLPRKL